MKTIQKIIVIVFLIPIITLSVFGQSQDFVSLQGNQFKLNGENFYPVVMNYGVSVYQDISNNSFFVGPHRNYENITPTNSTEGHNMLLEDFNTIKNKMNFNCIRLVGLTFGKICISSQGAVDVNCHHENNCASFSPWPAFSYGWPIVNYYQQIQAPYTVYFNLIEDVLDAAEQAGLKVIFLAGGKKLDTPDVQDEFEGNGYVAGGYLKKLVEKFKDNSTLFAYDFWNEPMYNDDQCYTKTAICEIVGKWNNIVHNNSSHHLTTIGLGYTSGIFEWDHGVMEIDFASFHFYPSSLFELTSDPTPTQLTQAFNMMKSELYWFGNTSPIPWIIGETGFSASLDLNIVDDFGTIDDQGNYANITLNQCRDCNGSGYSWWWYQDVNYGTAYWGLIDRDENLKYPAINEFNNFNPQININCEKPINYYNYYNYNDSWVKGTVKDQFGVPIENAIVSLRAADWTGDIYKTYTKSDGKFTVYTDIPHSKISNLMRIQITAVGATIYEDVSVYLDSDIGDICINQFQPPETININNKVVDYNDDYLVEVSKTITTNDILIKGNGITGGKYKLSAGSRILLASDFKAQKGSRFHAYNAPVYMDCDYLLNNCKEPKTLEMGEIYLSLDEENYLERNEIVSVYPNPTTDIINIKLPVLNSNSTIILRDMNGEILFENEYEKERYLITFNASKFHAGVYSLTVINKEFTVVKKLILQ